MNAPFHTNDAFKSNAKAIARAVLGECNRAHSSETEWRYGTNGSLSVVVAGERAGTWHDHENGQGGGMLELVQSRRNLDKAGALDFIRTAGANLEPIKIPSLPVARPKVVKEYLYHDEQGQVLFRVARMEPKTFRQWSGSVGRNALGETRRVLYRLPSIIEASPDKPIFIVEGEKDADNLVAQGLIATCNPMGASAGKGKSKWRHEYSDCLKGRHVIIVADNDEAGRTHANVVATSVLKTAASVRVVDLPGLPEKGDVSDWLEAGHTGDELLQIARQTPALNKTPAAVTREDRNRQKAISSLGMDIQHRPKWISELSVNDRGEFRSNLANAMIPLRSAPELRDLVKFNAMTGETILQYPVPSKHIDIADFQPRPITDVDISQVQEWLQVQALASLSKDTIHQAIEMRAHERQFHPVRDWLVSIEWDRRPRVETWLSQYLRAEDTPYTRAIGTMFLVAMVARVIQPGCKADYLLILEGEQGVRKSTACAILGGEYFSDNMPPVRDGSKDLSQHLQGKWLLEIAEMSSTSKAEAESLKAFVTRPVERYRPPYGRKDIIQPRQCVFIGTTNKSEYLRDETGARRFWPVKVGIDRAVDTAALSADREQLFAEAVQLYRDKVAWWPDGDFEKQYITPEQEGRYEIDPWEASIRDYLQGRSSIQLMEVARQAIFLDIKGVGTAESRRISVILRRLGWEQRKGAKGVRLWRPKV